MAEISEKKLITMLDAQAKNLCCNRRADGYCYTKDMMCAWHKSGEEFSNRGITCRWFREAVLPGDKELEQIYLQWRESIIASYDKDDAVPVERLSVDLCEYCKKPLAKQSNSQKYCTECTAIVTKKKKAAYLREMRNGLQPKMK